MIQTVFIISNTIAVGIISIIINIIITVCDLIIILVVVTGFEQMHGADMFICIIVIILIIIPRFECQCFAWFDIKIDFRLVVLIVFVFCLIEMPDESEEH